MRLENKTEIKSIESIKDVRMTLTNIKDMTEESIKNIETTDEHLTTELILFTENEYDIYKNLECYKENLRKKIEKDIFDYSKAVHGVRNIIDDSIKRYLRLFTTYTRISDYIDINNRIYIYKYFVDDIIDKISHDEL